MTFAEKIKKLRKDNRMTQKDLAKMLGVVPTAVSAWEQGKNKPLMDKITIMSNRFDVPISYFFDIEESVATEKVVKLPEVNKDEIELPLYGDVAAGALAELESVDVWDVETVKLPKFLLPQNISHDKLFAMHVNGDSMDKIIPNGSLIVVKPIEQSLYKDGDIVVFSYNGEYSLKKYRPNAMEGFVLFEADSVNPDFKNIPISKSDLFEANMYGKVIFCGITF